jgi:cytochrome P450
MLGLDPPRHRRLRSLVSHAFTTDRARSCSRSVIIRCGCRVDRER